MKARNTMPPEERGDRYLGEIAPLLEAAKDLEPLTEGQRMAVRRRIRHTVFLGRGVLRRSRLFPAIAALGLLIVGGAAFAMVERLGLVARMTGRATDPPPLAEASKRKLRRTARPPGSEPVATPEERVEADSIPQAATAAERPQGPSEQLSVEVAAPPPASPAKSLAPEPRAARATPRPGPPPRPRKALAFVAPVSPAGSTASTFVPASEDSLAAPRAAEAAAPPEALAPLPPQGDQALFGQAMRLLRAGRNPEVALEALREHARWYPASALAGERAALEVEALLALHREPEALALLDGMPLERLPRSGERLVMRGELRAAVRRWQQASADFDQALAKVSGSPLWHERALWGRAVARLRVGYQREGMADVEAYLDRYPKGRFAAQAAKLFSAR